MPAFDAAPGEATPGARPVGRFAYCQHISAELWRDVAQRNAVLRHMEERLVLDAYRQGAGLLERPEKTVREMVWDWRSLAGYREARMGERVDAYDVRLVAKAVEFDG